MRTKQNVLEINGNRYDVQTGRLMGRRQSDVKTIDGFVRRRPNDLPAAPTSHKHKQNHKPSIAVRSTAVISHAVHAKTVPSKTLMRHAVQKPTQIAGPHAKKRIPGLHSPARLSRAKQVPQSMLIKKFGGGVSPLSKKIKPLPVREEPAGPRSDTPATSVVLPQRTLTLSPFEATLRKADNHAHPKLKKTAGRHQIARKLRLNRKALNALSIALSVLIISGVIAYRSLPGIAVSLASSRAGVEASLPDYSPTGFSLSRPIEYSKGMVILNYKSDSDQRSFRLIQRKSDWNSQSLASEFVANHGNVDVLESKGRTIFIYSGHNATWVSGGVWYQIEDASKLSYDQFLKIAGSL